MTDSIINNLVIDADTETLNNQLNKNQPTGTDPGRLIKINKDVLKTLIIEWLALDDQIKSFRDAAKDKLTEKKQFESKIIELMNILQQEKIITNKCNIIKNSKEHKGPITSDLIKTTLTEILQNSETAETYTNQIINKRQIKETVTLKKECDSQQKKYKKQKI